MFLFIRHGEADYSHCRDRGFKGHGYDLAQLTEMGICQIKKTSEDIRLKDADILISAPYTRALQSAAIISKKTEMDINIEVDVHEWIADKSFGFITFEEVKELSNDFKRNKGYYPSSKDKLWEDMTRCTKIRCEAE